MSMVVVAGATGRVGSVCASELLARGTPLRVIVRPGSQAAVWSRRGAEVAVGSLSDRAFLTAALAGAAGFFTLLPENVTSEDFLGEQRHTADAIAGAVAASGVPQVVILLALAALLPAGNGRARACITCRRRSAQAAPD